MPVKPTSLISHLSYVLVELGFDCIDVDVFDVVRAVLKHDKRKKKLELSFCQRFFLVF
jgi:hypothetical protein